MPLDRNGLEILPRDACLELLRSRTIGRVGLTRDALPTILPVNYRLVDEQIVYATGTGSKSLAALHEQVVAFEVDDADSARREGWSVVVVGIPRELDDGDRHATRAVAMGLRPWIGERAPYLFRLSTERLTGRRVAVRPAASAPAHHVP
ncbi:MAG TPA: pyridoxamine 5'-phosphate oxidase family protein [Acidimicrobiales bacterium]|nr:pyridoxamine 5'-phosphate oxidase family protein [Acidimicrobiales bacterium]